MEKMSGKRLKIIRNHFEQEAAEFDANFYRIAPHYKDMIRSAAELLPFAKADKVKILDLGCGTGNLTGEILALFPDASVTCVDIAENMLRLAKTKFKKNSNIIYRRCDIRKFYCKEKFDAVVSSLVLHHIEKKEKQKFFDIIFKSLFRGGIFVSVDILSSGNRRIKEIFIAKWREFANSMGIKEKQFQEVLAMHRKEDRPVTMEQELAMMRKSGFKDVEVILRHYYFALYCGHK
ncbi:MAG: hypothetical protein BWY26_00186 [Elusimicrobia bacterium ADurb.Bin231]|nr:MAG: hypothetical protein BWY26_00186 [Elusimicrobia bacterium ADurb.Bin231]